MNVALLDLEGLLLGHDDADIGEGLAPAAVPAGQGDGLHTLGTGDHESVHDVARVTGSGDAHEDVSRMSQRVDELREGGWPFDIVGVCGIGCVEGGQGHCRETSLEVTRELLPGLAVEPLELGYELGVHGALEHERFGQFSGDVVAVGGTASVPCDEELSLVLVALQEDEVRIGDVLPAY